MEIEGLMDLVLDHENRSSPFLARYRAIKAHCLIKRGNAFVDLGRIEDGRKLLLAVEETLVPIAQDEDVIYVFLELLIALGHSFSADKIFPRALTYFVRAERNYQHFKNSKKIPTPFWELLELDVKNKQKWTLKYLNQLIKISIFTCAVARQDEILILDYAVLHFGAKAELAKCDGEPWTPLQIIEKCLELTQLYEGGNFLKQAEHLLAVALYTLDKEQKVAKEKKELDTLQYKIALKYVWLGCQILHKSAQLIEAKCMEKFGKKMPKETLLKLQAYHKCERLDKLVGPGFKEYENLYPCKYLSDATETVPLLKAVKVWVKRGINLAEKLQMDRTPFICSMEDILTIEKKFRPAMKAQKATKTIVLDE